MAKPRYLALLLLVVLAGPAAAQTTATTSGVAGATLANPYGAVALPGTTPPSTALTAPSNSAAITAPVGGSGSAAGAGPGASAPAASPASSRASAAGTAARSNNVPDWLLCPPSGAMGMAPFVTGTNLSCAP